MVVKSPVCQVVVPVEGQSGIYQQLSVSLPNMKLSKYKEMALTPNFATPINKTNEELEQIYWEQITSHAAIYGADQERSLTDKTQQHWNIRELGTILSKTLNKKKPTSNKSKKNKKQSQEIIGGVSTPYLYFGMWKAGFAVHSEDMHLYSINFLHFGQPKCWYSIPPSAGRKFEEKCAEALKKSAKACNQFLHHKHTIVSPQWLEANGIPYDKIVQNCGEIIITFPFGYHEGKVDKQMEI